MIAIGAQTIGEGAQRQFKIPYQDNGIGFSNEYAYRIFDVFARLHTRDQFEGTGRGWPL